MQVEQIDREAAAPFMPYLVLDISETSFAQAFARHRHQARAEVVGEIVAWLRENDVYGEWQEGVATIEAKFGGPDLANHG